MKYIEPKMEITVFDKEDIVTALSLPILPFFNGYNDDDIEDTLNP